MTTSLTELRADLQRAEGNPASDFGGEACGGNTAVRGGSRARVRVPCQKVLRAPFEIFQALVMLIGIFGFMSQVGY